MRTNGDLIEVVCFQRNKGNNIVCGDTFLSHTCKEEGRVSSVLVDARGSGMQGSVL